MKPEPQLGGPEIGAVAVADVAVRAELVTALAELQQALGPPDIRQARGCSECGGLGFTGRATIAEILLVNADIHRLILSGTSESQIDDAARKMGMISMYETGAAKVWRGETTIDEVLRATRM